MQPKVMLFDVDGVLVQSDGYWTARESAIKFFMDQLEWDIPAPGPEIPPLLESYGVTSEWDMIPLCLAIILDAAWGKLTTKPTADTLEQAFRIIRDSQLSAGEIDYLGEIRRFRPLFGLASVPSNALLNSCAGEINPEILPNIRKQPFLDELLGYTRDIHKSATFRIFQNIALGADVFFRTYQLIPEIQVESYLDKYDQPLVRQEICTELKRGMAQGYLYLSALTARPSLPPKEIHSYNHKYTPEAEMALKIVGLEEIALMSFGRMNYLAEQMDDETDHLLKPSPVQGLAALRAALTGEELRSLEWAYEISREDQNNQPVKVLLDWLPDEIELHVFEDSTTGIQSVKSAVKILEKYDVHIRWYAWGIASHVEKVAALKKLGAEIVPDINMAIKAALAL